MDPFNVFRLNLDVFLPFLNSKFCLCLFISVYCVVTKYLGDKMQRGLCLIISWNKNEKNDVMWFVWCKQWIGFAPKIPWCNLSGLHVQ